MRPLKRKKPRVGVGLVLLVLGVINIVGVADSQMADDGEAIGYFGIAGVMLALGLWFLFRGRDGNAAA